MKNTITKIEQQVLYMKYIQEGMDSFSASEKVKEIKEKLRKLEVKLIKKEKTKEEIGVAFREEFNKLIAGRT